MSEENEVVESDTSTAPTADALRAAHYERILAMNREVASASLDADNDAK